MVVSAPFSRFSTRRTVEIEGISPILSCEYQRLWCIGIRCLPLRYNQASPREHLTYGYGQLSNLVVLERGIDHWNIYTWRSTGDQVCSLPCPSVSSCNTLSLLRCFACPFIEFPTWFFFPISLFSLRHFRRKRSLLIRLSWTGWDFLFSSLD